LVCVSFTSAWAQNAITLPIEVTGADGTAKSVEVIVPAGSSERVRSLWVQIHGLEYPDMVSIRVNQSEWVPLNNKTVSVAEPGRSYGGIGGGVATLKLTLALPAATVVNGTNRIDFRFNRTNGVVSGFRILAFNFLDNGGSAILPADEFVAEDPNTWTPPFRDAANIAAGKNLWHSASLTANGLPNAPPIRARCSDCHTQDGRDLKYFNFSNASIAARSRFHGLSELEGEQIASYIRSLPFANPGRPWNPPYQPGPGLDAQPVVNWAAGAGLQWVLDNDVETLPFLFPGAGDGDKVRLTPAAIRLAAFSPDGNLNPREIPIAFPLPDWNHWLPQVHPMDNWGDRFENSAFSRLYAASDYEQAVSAGDAAAFFDKWSKARSQFLTPHLTAGSKKWTPELSEVFYSAELWQLVKTWEITQQLGLEKGGQAFYGAETKAHSWPDLVPAGTAPASVNIPDGPNGMGGSALTNEYFTNAWYELQMVSNNGEHRRHGRLPVDWVYVIGRFRDLEKVSGRAEPGRLLIAIIQAMQASDPNIGPENISEGWRPEQNVDPRIMVDPEWMAAFAPLPKDVKRAITEAWLEAWLEKTLRYPAASYFQRGSVASSYARPTDLEGISGGQAWDSVPEFRAAGVNSRLTQRLEQWGKAYRDLAQLFHY